MSGVRLTAARLRLRDCDAPGRVADRHRLHHLQAGHVDHRDVVAVAVGDEEQAVVRREGKLPYPLADQQIFLDLEFFRVDHGDPIGRAQRHGRTSEIGY